MAEPFVRRWGLVAVFVMLFSEHLALLGYFSQANTTLLLYGYFSGVAGSDLLVAVVVAVVAAVLGSQLSKYLGARFGHGLLAHWKVDAPDTLQHALENRAIAVGALYHFSAALRPTVPVVAGTMGVPVTWVVPDALGAAIWSASVLLIGRFFGASFSEDPDALVPRLVLSAVALIALTVFMFHVRSFVLAQGRSR